MKITVEQQKNNKERFSLYSDGKYIMSVSYENLAPFGYVEFEISDSDLEYLKYKEDYDKIFRKAVNYATRGYKSKKEVIDWMYKNKIEKVIHDEVINYLEEYVLLDDKAYLEMYLEEKFNFTTDGSIKIKNKLYQKGFDGKEIDPYLPKYREIERANLKKLIEDRKKSKPNDDNQKLIRYLLNKGYEYSMIREEMGNFYDDEY